MQVQIRYNAVLMSNGPTVNAPSTSTTGGTLAAATYFYKVTAVYPTDSDQSSAANEVSQVTTGSTSTVTLTWPAVPGAIGFNIYRSTSTGSEVYLTSVGPGILTYTDTGAVTPGTATVPTQGKYTMYEAHGLGAFLATSTGSITVIDGAGNTILNAFPVTAGQRIDLTLYPQMFPTNSFQVLLGGTAPGAAGTLLYH